MNILKIKNDRKYGHKPVCFITPINFAHKAGDGIKTRKHNATIIHPALQANCGGTQMTFLLEIWSETNGK